MMAKQEELSQVSLQSLLQREVVTSEGRKLGRIYDFVAERQGDYLCVTQLLVGPGAWLSRYGWKRQEHGTRVRWESIESLHPQVLVRNEDRLR